MVRYFFLSLNVLNGLLALAVAAVVYFAVIPLLNPVARISLPSVRGTAAPPGEQTTPSRHFPVTDYAVISDKNLFHPERKIPLEKQPERAVPKPDVVLYGTLITDDASYAFIEDKKAPYSTPGRAKRQITLKKGDHLNGYTLREITETHIVLVKGEETLLVMLDDREEKRTDKAAAMSPAARTAAVGMTPSPPPASSSPQAMPSSKPAVASPRPGIAGPLPRLSPPPPAPSSPQTMPSSTPAVASPGPGIAGPLQRPSPQPSLPTSPQMMPPSAQEMTPSRPGVGGSGAWPPTQSSVEQTQQKIQEGRQMRAGQLPTN